MGKIQLGLPCTSLLPPVQVCGTLRSLSQGLLMPKDQLVRWCLCTETLLALG